MKKILFVATVASHLNAFHLDDFQFFKEAGWEVHVAIGTDPEIRGEKHVFDCDKQYIIDVSRIPWKMQNFRGIKQLKDIINKEKYDIIHAHTPMGGVVARVAARESRKKFSTKVLYTCHGAHFYKGAPFINWLIYYPIEKILAHLTDCFIAINQEDYECAKRRIEAKTVCYVLGVGYQDKFKKYLPDEKLFLREKLGLKNDSFYIGFVGELNDNKNQTFLIKVVKYIKDNFKIPITLLLVGEGKNKVKLKEFIQNEQLEDEVKMLGYREDIPEILGAMDVYVAASKREGLAVNIMEALASGLPVVCTKARGQSELILNEKCGYILEKDDMIHFAEKVVFLLKNQEIRCEFAECAAKHAAQYSKKEIRPLIEKVYQRYL